VFTAIRSGLRPGRDRWSLIAASVLVAAGGALAVRADCPPAAQLASRLEALPLEAASRTERFQIPIPEGLYESALAQPDTPIPSRRGKLIQGVMLSRLPVEEWWKAINDDDHHATGGYLPLLHSEVLLGAPGHSGRETLQYYRRAGFGRWWVNRLETNVPLYESSGGALWELRWRDVVDRYTAESLPSDAGIRSPHIDEAWGAWLLASLGDRCTLIEYVAGGEAGGLVGALQWMGMTRTLLTTFRGMVQIAEQHLSEPHSSGLFVRPDGTPLEP